jgi:hypothetical protein
MKLDINDALSLELNEMASHQHPFGLEQSHRANQNLARKPISISLSAAELVGRSQRCSNRGNRHDVLERIA